MDCNVVSDSRAADAPAKAPRAGVLVVDDKPENRALLRAYLEPSYDVAEAGSGAEALTVLEGGAIDLVLLDVMMPERSGFDVCRDIKGTFRRPFLPVILVTALHDQEDRNDGLAAGADDFLSKPVDRRELGLRVRAFLKLREQEIELVRLQTLKDDLFALVLHDVRNPLVGVLGYLEIMSQEVSSASVPPGLRQDIEHVTQAANRVRELLDGLLEVRLLEEGELKLARAPVRIGDVTAAAISGIEGAARPRSVELVLSGALDEVIKIDAKLVRRLIENLVANAVKYAPKGSRVEVNVGASPGSVVLEVADSGPGVPDPLKASLFQKFGSVEARQGGMRRGVGLGLYLVKLVATAHGGHVSVGDREGGGSVFRISLPRGT